MVVLIGQLLNHPEGVARVGGILQRLLAVAPLAQLDALRCAEGLHVHVVGTLHGVLDELEEGVAQPVGDAGLQGVDALGQRLVVADAAVFVVVGVADDVQMLGLAPCRQPVVVGFDGGQLVGHGLAESPGRPGAVVADGLRGRPLVDVPCQVHAELQLHLGGLDVAHVDDPQRADALVVGPRQLVADDGWRVRGYPQVVGGRAPVRQVVVHTVATLPGLFGGLGQLAYVTVVVVDPAQGDILGHLQAGVVGVEHLLVGDEELRHLRGVAEILAQQLALEADNLGQTPHLVVGGGIAADAPVVNAAHAQGVHAVVAHALGHALLPVAFYLRLVRHVVPVLVVAVPGAVAPLPLVVAQHLLAVARTQHDVVFLGHGQVGLVGPESLRAEVHGRPQRVGPEAQ